jgi:hypothetical protein
VTWLGRGRGALVGPACVRAVGPACARAVGPALAREGGGAVCLALSLSLSLSFSCSVCVIVDARLVPKRVINYFLSNQVFLVLWFIWY